MHLISIFFIFFTIVSSLVYCTETINVVDHKDSHLNLYLDFIKYNIQEKLGILPYIMKNPNGTYLEVGTGGDPIAQLLSKIPSHMSPTIIASDIDKNILDVLPLRHPQLKKFLNNRGSGPKLKLQQLDATSMINFPDNFLDGINASAVVHEIVSYAGGMEGLDKFFSESLRVLKPNGILIYRDPESVENKEEIVTAAFKTPPIRLFVHIFIFKFLDRIHGKLALAGRKSEKYNHKNVTFTFYKKNESLPCTLTCEEYLKLRSYEIDFSRQYSLSIPRGLCREIERHYLTYLHQCNPLIFVKCIPHVDSETFFVNFLAHSTPHILDEFLRSNNLSMNDGAIDIKTKRILNTTISNNTKAIEYGIPLFFSSKNKERLFCNLLKQHSFEPNTYIIPIKENCYLLDYRIFGLLYDHMAETIFDSNNGPVNIEDTVHAEWLKREGEETYIYYSDDELITKVAEITLNYNNNDVAHSESFILCPINVEQNKFIPRLCYEEILKTSIDINDKFGFPIEIKEGKRIIHFGKLPIQDALLIYEDIIKSNSEHYQNLHHFVNNVLTKKVFNRHL